MITPVITIFVRHSSDCKYTGDEFCKRCACRKHLRWSMGGRQYRKQAGTRSWAEAEEIKRRLEAQLSGKALPADDAPALWTVRAALDSFLKAKTVKGLEEDTVARYKTELERFVAFCEGRGVFAMSVITLDLLTDFQSTWPELYTSSYTRHFVQKRLGVFLRYAFHAGWLARVPKLEPIKITEPPTMPLTLKEYDQLLAAVPLVFPNGLGHRVRAVIQFMRYTGLAVRDASTMKRDALEYDEAKGVYRVTTSRQKTGVHVSMPIPHDVAAEILQVANGDPDYLFWNRQSGESDPKYASHRMSINISRVFAKAKIRTEGHMLSHRLRDTFAVDLLEKGVPLEEVSKLLGHESIQTTERHYAKWVRGRQDRLDALVTGTWSRK